MPAKKSARRPDNRPENRAGKSPAAAKRGGSRRVGTASGGVAPGGSGPGGSGPVGQRRRVTKPRAARSDRRSSETTGDESVPKRMRLQRALAAAGFGSRRQCEELILEGRVEVDGSIVDQLGSTIDPSAAKVFVDGTPLKSRRLVYYIVNKPTGVVTTNADPEGRPRVIDLVPPDERVFPVGRLDRSSEGLILLTNDGDLAQRLAHPKYEVQKVYRVTVAGNVQAETVRQMHEGIYIAEGLVKVEGARVLKARPRATEMEITLKEGKNREIRRILARLGHKVQTLKRIAIGMLKLGEMPTGAYRRLTVEEIRKLKTFVESAAESADESTPAARKSPRPGKSSRPDRPAAASRVAREPRTQNVTDSGGDFPAPIKRAKRERRSDRTENPSALSIQLPGILRRKSGIVIGAESPPDATESKSPLPSEFGDELPPGSYRGRRDRSSRFEAAEESDFEADGGDDRPGGNSGSRQGAKTGGKIGGKPRGKRAGKTIVLTKVAGGKAAGGKPRGQAPAARSDRPPRPGKNAGRNPGKSTGKKRPGGRGKRGD